LRKIINTDEIGKIMKHKSNDNWKEGIAFVRGINIYKNARMTQEQMLKLCKKIENRNLKIVKVVNTDNIILRKEAYIMQLWDQNWRRFYQNILENQFM